MKVALLIFFLLASLHSGSPAEIPATHALPSRSDSLEARALVREAMNAVPPITDISRKRMSWRGEATNDWVIKNEELFTLAKLVTMQWIVGDTVEARKNSETLCSYIPAGRGCTHPGSILICGLRRSGRLAVARELLDIALKSLAPRPGEELGMSRGDLAVELAAFDSNAAVQLVTGKATDAGAEKRLVAFAVQLQQNGEPLLAAVQTPELRNQYFNNRAFNLVYSDMVHADPKDFLKVMALVDSMPYTAQQRPFLLARIAESARSAGFTDLSDEALARSLSCFAPGPNPGWELGSAGEIIGRVFVSSGRIDRARELLTMLPGRSQRSILLQIAGALGREGLIDSALSVLAEARTTDPGRYRDRDDGFAAWARDLTRSGFDSLALAVAGSLETSKNRGKAFGLIAAVQAERGDVDEARRTMGLIEGSPEGLAEALKAIILAEAGANQIDAALATLAGVPGALASQGAGDDMLDYTMRVARYRLAHLETIRPRIHDVLLNTEGFNRAHPLLIVAEKIVAPYLVE